MLPKAKAQHYYRDKTGPSFIYPLEMLQNASRIAAMRLHLATMVEVEMTGIEFRAALSEHGFTQSEFASIMGVHRTVIGRQFAAKVVGQMWVYALAGLMAARTASTISMIVK